MRKSTQVTLLFVLIFLIGVLGFVTYINASFNKDQSIEPVGPSEEITLEYSRMQ